MAKTRTAKAVLSAMVTAISLTAFAADDQPSLSTSVSAAFMGKYVWRGQLLNDDMVMQPSVGVSYGNLSASVWGNWDTTAYHGTSGDFTEFDWTVGYADKLPGVDILNYSFGMIYYHFYPSSIASTTELYYGIGLDVPLSPTLTIYQDIDEADGIYAALSVSHSFDKIFEISPDMPVGMTMSASTGWGNSKYNKFYWGGIDSAKMNDLTLAVGFPVEIMGFSVTPSVNYVTLLSSALRSADTYATSTGNDGSDYLFAGITISKSF